MNRKVPVPLLLTILFLAPATAAEPGPRPVSTYSIVAIDLESQEVGVAVQSHWFSVGSVVTWAEAGAGAVATQSFVETAYGPRGLQAMRQGKKPAVVLQRLLAEDDHADVRQVAFIDTTGRVAAHTGENCIPAAGHLTGDGYSVQANLMLSDEVPATMAAAFERATGPLAERMLAALEAAESVGGDIRGKQSAAILVVPLTHSDRPWDDRTVDLRVEDSADPLSEISRLLRLHRAYEHMNAGDEAVTSGDMDRALKEYSAAGKMFPDHHEFVFWHAYALVTNGQVDESLPLFARAFRLQPSWMLLVPRLAEKGHLPENPALMEKILSVGPSH